MHWLLVKTTVLFVVCLSTSSFASMRHCKLPPGNQSEASALLKVIKLDQKILDVVESVSDNDASYLKKEVERAAQQQNGGRLLTLMEHQSYRAWSVRENIAEANEWLEISQSILGSNSKPARQIAGVNLLSAMDQFNMLVISIDSYTHFDRSRSRPYLEASDYTHMIVSAYQAQDELIGVLACLMER